MGRTSRVQLNARRREKKILAQQGKIEQQERRIKSLKRIIEEICTRYDIVPPDLRFDHYVPVCRTVNRQGTEDEGCCPHSELGDRLISELVMNQGRRKRCHSLEMKKFCAIMFMKSPAAYNVLSEVLPVPCAKTIIRFSKPEIADVSSRLESLEGARQTLKEIRARVPESQRILCNIAVDACSHTNYLCRQESGESFGKHVEIEEFLAQFQDPTELSSEEVHKYCFVFYLEPLMAEIPCTALFMCSEKNGKANYKHTTLLKELRQIAVEEGFTVVMLCSDGDSEYYCDQRESFNIITHYCAGFNNIDDVAFVGKCLLNGRCLFCSDMLHLLKNGRTRLLSPLVSMNVRYPKSLNIQEMVEVLKLPDECFRNTPLNKMVDALPLLIFSFENAHTLFKAGLYPESMFVLFFSLFQGFFRAQCRYAVRVGLGITFLRTAARYMKYLKDTIGKKTCRCLEFHRAGAFVCMFPMINLERMAATVATVLSLLLTLPDGTEICLNRCSTHPLENFFGLLRTFCSFQHTYTNIRDKVARTQVIRRFKEDLGMDMSIRTRVNIAGERATVSKQDTCFVDTDYSIGIMSIIDGYYTEQTTGVELSPHVYTVMEQFIEGLSQIPLPSANVQGKFSGLQIMNRLIANSRQ